MSIICLQEDDLSSKYVFHSDPSQNSRIGELEHFMEKIGIDQPAHNFWSTGDWDKSLEDLIRGVPKHYSDVYERQQEVHKIREVFRQFIESIRLTAQIYSDIGNLAVHVGENGTYHLAGLRPVFDGISGTYLLTDPKNKSPQFIVKPFDEEAGCINNPKSLHGATKENPIRDYLPLYRSAMREVLAYRNAEIIGVDSIIPTTVLAIIHANQFHDYSERLSEPKLKQYFKDCGPVDKEKLCSVQQFVPNSKPLWQLINELEAFGLSAQEMASRFDQADFEKINILVWTTYDTDAHMGNILVYPKRVDSLGNEIYGIKKIDNGLAFPEKNLQLRNGLAYLLNAELPLSSEARERIAKIDPEALAEQYRIYGLESAIPAMRKRVSFLKQIANQPGITIKGINKLMFIVEDYFEVDTYSSSSDLSGDF